MHIILDRFIPLASCTFCDRDFFFWYKVLKNTKIHLVTAIANPDFLIRSLEDLNIVVIPHIYPDHELLNQDDFYFKDDLKVIMTEKDFVKCINFKLKNAYYIPTKIIVDNDIKIMLNDKISNLLRI